MRKLYLPLLVAGFLIGGLSLFEVFATPAPKSKSMLKCEISLSASTVADPSDVSASIKITNLTDADLEYRWTIDPFQSTIIHYLNVESNETERIIYRERFSIIKKEQEVVLKPGKPYEGRIQALLALSPKPIRAGKYKIHITFAYHKKSYTSNAVELEIRP